MANSGARGIGSARNKTKQNAAQAGTRGGASKGRDSMQAGSGGRGGHRKRKGGSPEG
jgi:hypothetical protein